MRVLYWLMLAASLTLGCGGDDKAADGDEDNVADDGTDNDDAGPCGITSQVSCQAACSNVATVCADSPHDDMANLDVDACTEECVDEPWGAGFVQCSTEAQTCNAVFACDEESEGSDTGD